MICNLSLVTSAAVWLRLQVRYDGASETQSSIFEVESNFLINRFPVRRPICFCRTY